MKTISIQQPWAALVARGIKDIENRTTRMVTPPQRLLIHVGVTSRIRIDQFPLCWHLPVVNAEIFGQIDEEADVQVKSAIIGYVDVVDIVEDSKSVWAQYPEPGEKPIYHYVLRNAHLFKQPILNVKGKLGIWDYPGIDENHLPETVEIPQVTREGDTLTFPCDAQAWEDLRTYLRESNNDDTFTYTIDLLDNIRDLLVHPGEQFQPLDTRTIRFTREGETIELKVREITFVEPRFDDNDEIVTYDDPQGNIHTAIQVNFVASTD